MTRHQQERSSGQVLSLLTFIIKNESPRHVGLRHRIRIGELQLSWQNRPAGYSRLSIPPDWCLSYLQCRFGHISTISFLYISFTLVLCFLCVYYYKLKGRCTLSFVMYRYWFFFRLVIYAMNIICNSLMLLVQVKSESDKLMLNVAVLILYLYI